MQYISGHNLFEDSIPVEVVWLKARNMSVLAMYNDGRAQMVLIQGSGHHACIVNHMLVLLQSDRQLLEELTKGSTCTLEEEVNKQMCGKAGFCIQLSGEGK